MLIKFGLIIAGLLIANVALCAPDKVAYELQERCGNATKAAFTKEWGDGIVSDKTFSATASYRNHYNSKLNKCFYLLTSSTLNSKSEPLNSTTLWDFNESNQIGEFRSQGSKSHCEFKGKDCKDADQFNMLVKPFMED